MNGSGICGLILSGGRSSRMGFDKGTIDYHGKPQIQYLQEQLKLFCDEVFLSSKTDTAAFHGIILKDLFELESPLNGILTAFDYNSNCAWLSLPVDMPLIDRRVIETLVTNRDQNAFATCFYSSEGRLPEPLLTIWEPRSAKALKTFYEQGNKSPRKFLIEHHVTCIEPVYPNMHTNINSPDELNDFLHS